MIAYFDTVLGSSRIENLECVNTVEDFDIGKNRVADFLEYQTQLSALVQIEAQFHGKGGAACGEAVAIEKRTILICDDFHDEPAEVGRSGDRGR